MVTSELKKIFFIVQNSLPNDQKIRLICLQCWSIVKNFHQLCLVVKQNYDKSTKWQSTENIKCLDESTNDILMVPLEENFTAANVTESYIKNEESVSEDSDKELISEFIAGMSIFCRNYFLFKEQFEYIFRDKKIRQ